MARTKAVNKPKPAQCAQTNGTPKTAGPPPTAFKSPAQTAELTEAERNKLKQWLDTNDKSFKVATVPLSHKRKRDAPALPVQTDLFEDRLNVQYEVKPGKQWTQLRKYKKFTVGSDSIATGQCILVHHGESDETKIEPHKQWKAKVLEVRALDPEHVYIRVSWLNRPEDCQGGRKSYHGKNELIPTNQMDVIDALAVNGVLDLVHWHETDDEAPMPVDDQFFWRQTFDFVNTKTFSKLRELCVDIRPQNPDELILQCSNEDCRKWLHLKCVAEKAVKAAAKEAPGSKKPTGKKARPKAADEPSQAQAEAYQGAFAAKVFIQGLPNGPGQMPEEKTELVITDENDENRSMSVCCLFCGGEIDD